MKINLLIISCIIALLSLALQGCHDSNEPTAQDEYLARLSSSWVIDEVTTGNKDVTGAFEDMELAVTGKKKFTVKNPVAPIWPASGSFSLREVPSSSEYSILRDDGIEATVLELTATTLILELQYTAPVGRTESVSGVYEFHFIKK